MKVVSNYEESWTEPTPFAYGSSEDSVLVLETSVICWNCGDIAQQRMSYVWKGTANKRLLDLHFGASVKHYFTSCTVCGANSSS